MVIMVVQAKVYRQEGNSIILKTTPVVGVVSLISFSDNATSTDSNAQFVKTFRYTLDGINYSDWQPLDLNHLLNIPINGSKVFIAELSYFQNQAPGSNALQVSSATLNINQATPEVLFYFNNSVFNKYFNNNDVDVLTWYVNVLEKLYNKGLLANYISRVDSNNNDEDFIAFWGSIAKFFAYYVKLARVFGSFYTNKDLLEDFLSQRGLLVSSNDTLDDLNFILETFYYQMAHRGTYKIVDKKENGAIVNGELLRAFDYQQGDEFSFCNYKRHQFGWTLDKSSPLYRGMRNHTELNKLPWSPNSIDLSNVGSYLVANTTHELLDNNCTLHITGNGGISGVGHPIPVDHRLDYQISFLIKADSTQQLTLNIAGLDSGGNQINNTSRQSGAATNNFFVNAVLSRTDKYIQVRCYLYNSARGNFVNDTTSIKQGHNIIANSTLSSIVLQLLTTGTGSTYIKDFKMIPLRTVYSRGFLEVSNFISIWGVNRNGTFSLRTLKDYIQRYLVSYKNLVKIENIGDVIYNDVEEVIDQTYWAGAGEYCRKVTWQGIDPACEIKSTMWIPDESTAICEQA